MSDSEVHLHVTWWTMIIVWSKCRGNPPVVALERVEIAQGKGNHRGIAPTDRFKR